MHTQTVTGTCFGSLLHIQTGTVNCFNNFCIIKLVLVPVFNIFRILELVLVSAAIFLHSQTRTGTSYLCHLQFKGVVSLEMIMCLPQYGVYLNKIVESVIPVLADQLVIVLDEIVKHISSFYCYFSIFLALL